MMTPEQRARADKIEQRLRGIGCPLGIYTKGGHSPSHVIDDILQAIEQWLDGKVTPLKAGDSQRREHPGLLRILSHEEGRAD
jgi:hypothetical protein